MPGARGLHRNYESISRYPPQARQQSPLPPPRRSRHQQTEVKWTVNLLVNAAKLASWQAGQGARLAALAGGVASCRDGSTFEIVDAHQLLGLAQLGSLAYFVLCTKDCLPVLPAHWGRLEAGSSQMRADSCPARLGPDISDALGVERALCACPNLDRCDSFFFFSSERIPPPRAAFRQKGTFPATTPLPLGFDPPPLNPASHRKGAAKSSARAPLR